MSTLTPRVQFLAQLQLRLIARLAPDLVSEDEMYYLSSIAGVELAEQGGSDEEPSDPAEWIRQCKARAWGETRRGR